MHDIFFFTDIHGMYNLYRAIINYCKEQDPEAMIIYGGDACDRGPDGYKIMKELLDNPQVIYLKGNHEDLFVKAAQEIKEKFGFQNPVRENVIKVLKSTTFFDEKYYNIQLHLHNGGLLTLVDWVMDGMPIDIIDQLEHLPYTFSYSNCDFCHAAGIYPTFERASDAEYEDRPVDQYDAESLLWSRSALDIGWKHGRIAVFGHTPTPYLKDYLNKFKWPEDCKITPVLYESNTIPEMTGWKLDMDTGAVFTGRAFVLNVLTMKVYGFEDKDFKNEEIHQHDIEKIEVIQF